MMSDADAEGNVTITHAAGLHARPAVKLTRLAKSFASSIELAPSSSGPWTDAKSIVKVMAAKIPGNAVLYLRAKGTDAAAAVDALVALVRGDFSDAEGGTT